MTVDEAVAEICGRLNLTSQDAKTRVAATFNRYYRTVTSTLGIDAARFTSVTATTTNGVATLEFTGLEKIDRVIDATTASAIRLLTEVTIHQVRSMQPGTGEPVCFAIQSTDANSVTIRMDTLPQTTYSLVADGWSTLGDLTGNDSPAIPASFHDILIQYVLAEEYERKEKTDLADRCFQKAEHRLSELRFHLADTGIDFRQGSSSVTTGTTGTSGGSGNQGGTSYTQTGLVTFSRGTSAPFACVSGAAVVTYLDADKLDGQHGTYYLDRANHTGTLTVASTGLTMSATDKLVGRDTASGGASEEIGVTGGIEFTGSGSIQTGAFTGDVTKTAGGTALTIASDAVTTAKILADNVTYAKMQNVSAASRLLGRGSASGSGDPEELTVGSNLSISGTAVNLATNVSVGGTLGVTGLITATAGQIAFPATQSASADANTLDDYEEGTWVPSLGGNTTYAVQTGTYTKVGRLVVVRGQIEVTTLGTGSTGTITGLPFTTAAFAFSGSVGFYQGAASSFASVGVYAAASGTSVLVTAVAAGGAASMGNPAVFFANSAILHFAVGYVV
jgi:hypothetical protein